MRIVSASVDGFRNLQTDDFTFSPRVNLVLGRNGEGKTNLLEALNWFALGRSHRGARSEELIRFDSEHLHVALEVEEDSGAVVRCEYGLGRDGGRRLRIDGEPLKRRADLVGRLATVFFNPDSIRLVRGGPDGRRQFADQGWSEIDPVYLTHLTAFQRALKQKTGLLRDLRRGFVDYSETRRELVAWNRELAGHAAVVCLGRRDYTALVTPFAGEAHNKLLDNDLHLEFFYLPKLASVARVFTEAGAADVAKDDLEREIRQEFDYIMDSEIRRGRPLIGPQLDDFKVVLDGVDLRVYGSQGETRSAAIALILARSDALYRKRQVRPVLFFDDIFSELDRERTRRLQEMASHLHQVFIATARRDDIADWRPEGMRAWRVAAGGFTEE
ncbi:DNA replication/repair protein RecF [bacterium]|nr:DNA replication/repair protein RecF [bacterium]